MNIKIRKVCETEVGDDRGFHYFEVETSLELLEENIVCPSHPEAVTRDIVIEMKIVTE